MNTTATAHEYWNTHWNAPDAKWLTPEEDVLAWAERMQPGSAVLDLGAGVGRHALALAAFGHHVAACDAAPEGLAKLDAQARSLGHAIATAQAPMTALPYPDATFDHVLSWNVIYHGDEDIVRAAIAEIARVLKPGGTFLGTMLSARRVPVECAKATGTEISRNTWVFDTDGDKRHPHHFCNAADLVALFAGFEPLRIEDREHETAGSWHWHILMERQ